MNGDGAGRPPDPIALVILTGFLGAGKTTLLNRLLLLPEFADSAVLVNEIGEIAVDHLLVRTGQDTVVALAFGCLCCTMRGEFVVSLEELLRALDNRRVPPFRRLVVETTGAADPVPLLQAVLAHPYLSLRFRPLSVVTVVDAVNGLATLSAYEEARRQVALAERVVLTKLDLSDAAERDVRAAVAAINPGAVVLVAGDAALRSFADAETAGAANTLAAELARYPADAAPAHDGALRTFLVASEAALSPPAFELFLTLLRGLHGPSLLRIKGFVRLSDDPARPMLIHGAQQVFHPPVRLDSWPDEDRRTRLVVVAKDLPPDAITAIYTAFA